MYTVQGRFRSPRSLKNEDPVSFNDLFTGYGKQVWFSLFDEEVQKLSNVNKTATLILNPTTGYQGVTEDGYGVIVRLSAIDLESIYIRDTFPITGRYRSYGRYKGEDAYILYTVPLKE